MFNLANLARRLYCRSFIGADIDASHLRFVEISHKKEQYQIEKYAIYANRPEWKIQFAAEVFHTKKIILTVSENQILTKKIILSATLSEKEKEEYLLLAMEKHALCSSAELCMDFFVVNTLENNQQEIFCAAVRKQTIDSLLNIFHETGLHVYKITTSIEDKQAMSFSPLLEKIKQGEIVEKDALPFYKASESAMSGFDAHSLNFLPWRAKKRQQIKIKLGIAVFLLICLVSLLTFFGLQKNSIKKEPLKQTPIIKPVEKLSLPKETSLINTSLYHIKMIGYLQQNKKVWGLVKIPNGKMYHVTTGEKIGREQAKIIHIFPHYLVVQSTQSSLRGMFCIASGVQQCQT